jgi:hypothetical protein
MENTKNIEIIETAINALSNDLMKDATKRPTKSIFNRGYIDNVDQDCPICTGNMLISKSMGCCKAVMCAYCYVKLGACPFCRYVYDYEKDKQIKRDIISSNIMHLDNLIVTENHNMPIQQPLSGIPLFGYHSDDE